MRGLKRLFRRDDDRGAVAVLAAVLLSGGVLIGATAIVVDVGNLYAKREQLQAGADAAAWAIAQACIDSPDACTNQEQQPKADELVAAQMYGPQPGNNLSAAVAAQVCIEGIDCAVWNTDVECPSLRMTFGPYVEVRAYYDDAGDTIMPAPLAGAFSGEDKGSRVGACSRVSWGTAESLRLSSLALQAACIPSAFYSVPGIPDDTEDTIGAVPRRLSPPPANAATAIPEDDGTGTTCGFTWLDSGGTCAVEPTPPLDMAAAATSCPDALAEARDQHLPLLVPVYDSRAGMQVHVVGYAAYALTEYAGQADPAAVCTDPVMPCVAGYFTQMLAPRSQPRFSVEGALDYGVTVIGRTG
ncbi:pilus assembly protein TadG-related protein [Actinoplanes sp. TFC3]|uniref:pilus assembly protein TadG-related protein n=1 Tax=Actinoplanes sp. TFC3 TaxID=1710355 RepID=UPI00082D4B83|nr:pilus assembly protein TadG-related protein [Actinoplanes sp. TFC3]